MIIIIKNKKNKKKSLGFYCQSIIPIDVVVLEIFQSTIVKLVVILGVLCFLVL